MKGTCNHGGCTKPVYIGAFCIRCWAGAKFNTMRTRVRNWKGKFPCYAGLPLGFTRKEFVEWAVNNPPPKNMRRPSIDRIVPELGYVPGNVRWLELEVNARHSQRDMPEGMATCPRCKKVYPLTEEIWGKNSCPRHKRQCYCKKCKLEYDFQWRLKRKQQNDARC